MHRLLQAHHSWQDLLSKRRVCIVPATSTGNAAALLYGDWGTSKAYVIGFAFVAAGFMLFLSHPRGLRGDRRCRLQLHCRLRAFSRWRRGLFRSAAATPFPRLDRRPPPRREFYCHRRAQRLGGRECEAVADITGVIKLDPDSTAENLKVTRTAAEAAGPALSIK